MSRPVPQASDTQTSHNLGLATLDMGLCIASPTSVQAQQQQLQISNRSAMSQQPGSVDVIGNKICQELPQNCKGSSCLCSSIPSAMSHVFPVAATVANSAGELELEPLLNCLRLLAEQLLSGQHSYDAAVAVAEAFYRCAGAVAQRHVHFMGGQCC